MDEDTEPASAQALTRGLAVLRVLAESGTPLGATEIARRLDLHPSWVSRVLGALIRAGYVRKPDYRSFAVDYGVLALAGNALQHAPLAVRPRAAMESLARRSGMHVALAILRQGQLIYLGRSSPGQEPVPLAVGFPLHLSSVGLRLLLDLPEAEALAALAESRRRYGWEQPTPAVPASEQEALAHARTALVHDCLPLTDWYRDGHLGCAIPITVADEPRAALALSGPLAAQPLERALLWLQEGRREVEASLATAAHRAGAKA